VRDWHDGKAGKEQSVERVAERYLAFAERWAAAMPDRNV
jgi:hypothetical protein